MNIGALLERSALRSPNAPAVAVGRKAAWSFAELDRRARSLASAFARKLELRAGDRIVIAAQNRAEIVEVMFACWFGGFVATPINAKLHAREIEVILADSGARLVMCDAETGAPVGEATRACGDVRVMEMGSADYEGLLGADAAGLRPAAAEDPAWLFYTSGTTGRPKGATLTHRNLYAMTLGYFADVDAIAPGEQIVHAAPMSHGSGLYILPHIAAGSCQVVPESGRFDAAEILDLFDAYDRVTMFAAPTMVHRMVAAARRTRYDARGLKTIVYGGGPMYVEQCKQALDAFGPRLVQIYGQGETPMSITVLPKHAHLDVGDGRWDARLGSVGYRQCQLEVIVADDDLQSAPAGQVGEILVRGKTVMSGYWGAPQASAEALRGGWLHTGDRGVFDEFGYLTLKDRSKDVIISGGSNVYPREVEEALLVHADVDEVSVVGRTHPEWGEEVVAVISLKGERRPPEAELNALCGQRIARFKRPRSYVFVDAMPRNANGKILKSAVRKLLGDAS